MDIKSYLEQYQPRIFDFFSKAINSDTLPHSMIFSGAQGTLLKESAIYLAKSFLCLNKAPMACNQCVSCKKIEAGTSLNLHVFDTKEDAIKKAEISEMFDSFGFNSIDKNQKNYFYIINEAENLGDKILNSLLKTLEEPNSNVYAILTVHNEFKLLPTIVSRCRNFKFKQIPRQEIIDQCIKNNIEKFDAEILSKFYNSADLIGDIAKTDYYKNSKELFLTEIEAINGSIDTCFYEVIEAYNTKKLNSQETRFFLEMLSVFFEEVCSYHYGKEIYLTNIQEQIEKANELPIETILNGINYISEANKKLDFNCNISLILDNLNYSIKNK